MSGEKGLGTLKLAEPRNMTNVPSEGEFWILDYDTDLGTVLALRKKTWEDLGVGIRIFSYLFFLSSQYAFFNHRGPTCVPKIYNILCIP